MQEQKNPNDMVELQDENGNITLVPRHVAMRGGAVLTGTYTRPAGAGPGGYPAGAAPAGYGYGM